MALTGHCLAHMPRYTYAGGRCVQFIYGGCGYPNNNFGSQFECEQACLDWNTKSINPDFKLVTEDEE